MEQLQTYFRTTVSEDKLVASLDCSEEYNYNLVIDEQDVYTFLKHNKIQFGIDDEIVKLLSTVPDKSAFPFIVAKGIAPQHGINGKVEFEMSYSNEIVRNPTWNFRDIMKIPSVKTGQKLATILLPSDGVAGKSVYNTVIPAKPGKPAKLKAGKNTVFRKENNSVYATTEGQISVSNQSIHIHSVFEVDGSLSMKTGNLDFVGSIVINGDVPTGYKVKAGGDIKIFGMAEAAVIEAKGSVFIAEGLAGVQKGLITAGENIHTGYINQGNIKAGNDLYVENSIVHSDCTIGRQVYCQRGSIIGGTLLAGCTIEAKDVGNRLSSKTEIVFGFNQIISSSESELLAKKKEVESKLQQLLLLGKKLEGTGVQQDPQVKTMLLKQASSLDSVKQQGRLIEEQLKQFNNKSDKVEPAKLIVKGKLYPNVVITFGKYKRITDSMHNYVQMKLIKNEIVIQAI